jgi:hypothetical protein
MRFESLTSVSSVMAPVILQPEAISHVTFFFLICLESTMLSLNFRLIAHKSFSDAQQVRETDRHFGLATYGERRHRGRAICLYDLARYIL